jgi:hypothetical protein
MKVAERAPAGTVTGLGTVAFAFVEATLTTVPPEGALWLSVRVQFAVPPKTITAVSQVTAEIICVTGVLTVIVAPELEAAMAAADGDASTALAICTGTDADAVAVSCTVTFANTPSAIPV